MVNFLNNTMLSTFFLNTNKRVAFTNYLPDGRVSWTAFACMHFFSKQQMMFGIQRYRSLSTAGCKRDQKLKKIIK